VLADSVERFRMASAEGASWKDRDGLDQELLRPLSTAYEDLLHRRVAVDYPSMLTMPLRLFERDHQALRMIQDAYRFAVADEFQDTSPAQFRLLQHVVRRHHNLAVVGDPRQSIYQWRAADPAILLEFPRTYPDAHVFPLDQNHRSTRVVVSLSNALAAPLNYGVESWTTNVDGPRARIYGAADEVDEARFVAAEIESLLKGRVIEHAGEVAVLFRTNAQARTLALALRAAGLPLRVRADADLFGQPEVRDAVAYLRLAHCPADGPALARILNTPPRELRSIQQAFRKRPVPVADLPAWAQKRGGPPARQSVEQLLSFVEELHRATLSCRPIHALDIVVQKTGYAVWLAAQPQGLDRLAHLEELRSVVAASQAPDLGTWLLDLYLGEVDGPDPRDRAIILSTIHSAKGGEWPVVFVVGLEDGLIPRLSHSSRLTQDDYAHDEERRLAYVAVSRTQALLYLVYCRARRSNADGRPGPLEPRRPSRFLRSLPPDLIEHVERPRST
jgi:DNA helicase-2/ATP-dependent DNA helicase PcrA